MTISWISALKERTIEAIKGSGIGFFAEDRSLLIVIFDENNELQDNQILEFDQISEEVTVKIGKVDYIVTDKTK